MSPSELHELFLAAVGHYNAGHLSDAEKIYHRILAAHPDHPDALHLLGVIAHHRGQSQAAESLIRRAIQINPENADYHVNLGAVLIALNRHRPAIDALQTAVRINPRHTDAYVTLAAAYLRINDGDAAAQASQTALGLNPASSCEALCNLGAAMTLMGQHRQAAAAYHDALRLRPNLPLTRSSLIFAMLLDADCDESAIRAELSEWNRLHVAPLRHLIQPHRIDRSPDRRLRIGFVSSDFRRHVVAKCLLPLLNQFDRRRFRIFCYANVAHPDGMTARLAPPPMSGEIFTPSPTSGPPRSSAPIKLTSSSTLASTPARIA